VSVGQNDREGDLEMTGFFRRSDSLERELRAARPTPAAELVSRIEGRIGAERPRRAAFRYAVPAALTAATVAALAAVGGVSYAANSVAHAAEAVAHAFTPAQLHGHLTVAGATAGGDQYKPGYGFGDPNHNHTGPPGLQRKGGFFAPPLAPKIKGTTATIGTSFTIDEQAHLFISVLAKGGKKLVINQKKSNVGSGLRGANTKTIQYLVLVPRSIPLKLAVPARFLIPGRNYTIQVIARDPQGNKTTLKIPFRG
jgi:hypothetical protein